MSLNESIVENAVLIWFDALGYDMFHGPHMAPSKPMVERDLFGDMALVGRLREAILRLNQAILSRPLSTLRGVQLQKLRSGKLPTSFILSA